MPVRWIARLTFLAVVGTGAALVTVRASQSPLVAHGGGGWLAVVIQVAAVTSLAAAALAEVDRGGARTTVSILLVAAVSMVVAMVPLPELRPSWLFTLGLVAMSIGPVLLGTTTMLWPATERGRYATLLAVGAAGLVLLSWVSTAVFDPERSGCHACARNLVMVVSSDDLRSRVLTVESMGTIVWGLATVAYGTARIVSAPRIIRPLLAPVMAGAAGIALVSAVSSAYVLSLPTPEVDRLVQLFWLAECGFTVALAGAMITERLAFRRAIRRLTAGVTSATPDAAVLREVFSEAIGDRHLRLTFPRDSAPTADTEEDGLLEVRRERVVVARLSYRAGLGPMRPRLVTAVRSAGVALEYAAGQSALREDEAELAATRRRIVAVGDSERRRIERNLHDGAQSRLIALSMRTSRAVRTSESPAEVAILKQTSHDIDVCLEELRSIAHGIFPAALTDAGLVAALRELRDRSPVPLEVTCDSDLSAVSPAAGMAAYRLVADAVSDLVSVEADTLVKVATSFTEERLELLMTVDGASTHFDDRLAHARDRILALDGTVVVTEQEGRCLITVVIPCVS